MGLSYLTNSQCIRDPIFVRDLLRIRLRTCKEDESGIRVNFDRLLRRARKELDGPTFRRLKKDLKLSMEATWNMMKKKQDIKINKLVHSARNCMTHRGCMRQRRMDLKVPSSVDKSSEERIDPMEVKVGAHPRKIYRLLEIDHQFSSATDEELKYMLDYVLMSEVNQDDLNRKEPMVFGNIVLSDNEKEVLSNRPGFWYVWKIC